MTLPLALRLGSSLLDLPPQSNFNLSCLLLLIPTVLCTSRSNLLLDALQELQHCPGCINAMGPSSVF